MKTDPKLAVNGLSVAIGDRPILDDLTFDLLNGRSLGLVGESGSGKSLTALTLIGLLPNASHVTGSIRLDGEELVGLDETAQQSLRGEAIGMVFQEPMTALNPMQRAVDQVAETVSLHRDVSYDEARSLAVAQLDRVGLNVALGERYPHQLSGGQRQRVVVAIATVLRPGLIIADEPTTALDVVRQREVLSLLSELVAQDDTSLMLISHDLAIVAEMADEIVVMRDGRIVDRTTPMQLDAQEREPYTRSLVAASVLPTKVENSIGHDAPLLELWNIRREYGGGLFRGAPTIAVDNASLTVPIAGSVGLVGGSGCGKSTLARIAMMLDRPTSGTVTFGGETLTGLSDGELRPYRRDMQIVFQDPGGSFDPRRTVGWSVGEPLHLLSKLTRAERDDRIADAIRRVQISPDDRHRYPHEFSGGQRQRLAIARAIITEPKLIVADEAVSALDVSVRGRVLELFAELRDELGIALLFISHDLAVVRAVTSEVVVMEQGRVVERGPTSTVLHSPEHPVTQALLAASPDLETAIRSRQTSAANPTTPA